MRPLGFAVDDAVAQAHLFALELKLIPPTNCWLALGGSSTNASTRLLTARLRDAGAHVVDANRATLIVSLMKVVRLPTAKLDYAVISISSHGFEEGGDAIVMPSDGLRGALKDTGLPLKLVETHLNSSDAGRRLLFVDACRDQPSLEARGGSEGMSRGFRNDLSPAEGQAVFSSCDAGQISLERAELGHGVFTFFMLEGLRGKAASADGLITLGGMVDYVSREVEAWGRRNSSVDSSLRQQPWFKGPMVAKDILLARVGDIAIPPTSGLAPPQPPMSTKLANLAAYLLPKSTPPGTKKDYQEFADRFAKLSTNEIQDRMLKKTWIVLRDLKSWEEANDEAERLQARLPKLEELKTLMVYESQAANGSPEIFIDTRFFTRLDRTTRCWTSEGVFPRNKRYIDFAKRVSDSTSRSEMYAVILIRD